MKSLVSNAKRWLPSLLVLALLLVSSVALAGESDLKVPEDLHTKLLPGIGMTGKNLNAPSGPQIPQACRFVETACQELCAIGADSDADHSIAVIP